MLSRLSFGQDVPVTFSYDNPQASSAQLRGEAGINSPGTWNGDGGRMTEVRDGLFMVTRTLSVGGGDFSGSNGGYNYKFFVNNNWLSDPLNPLQNAADNNNSVVVVRSPMAFQWTWEDGGLLTLNNLMDLRVTLTSAASDTLDLENSRIEFNGEPMTSWLNFYDTSWNVLNIPADTVAPFLQNGSNSITANLITASGESQSYSISVTYQQAVEPELSEVPQGWTEGVNVLSPDSVGLVLLAPNKSYIYAIGDFSNWGVQDRFLMKKHIVSEDEVYWWVGIGGLEAATEYGYQFFIDGQQKVADPYAELLLHPDDTFISEEIFPNLKAYPQGQEHYISVFSTDEQWLHYDWQVENFERPAAEELVIYELLVRDWVATHDYQSVIDSLDYFERLGVNAIQLMPVMEFEGNESWGYNPVSHFAVDKYYGTPQKLKEFIDECHKRGIAVILDIVYNHMFGQAPLKRLYDGGNYGSNPTPDSPYFNVTSPNPVFSWGYDVNHESRFVEAYIDSASAYWIKEYKVDGFRFDFTKGMTNTPGDGGGYDAARIRILKRMADQIRAYDPTTYLILEHFADTREERELNAYGFLSWAAGTKFNSQEAAMGYPSDLRDFWHASSTLDYPNPLLVGYLESHDEERLMYKMLNFGDQDGEQDVRDLSIALDRMKTMGATFLIPGPKMLWQFGELGYDYSIDFNGRTGNKPIPWDLGYHEDVNRQKLFKVWAELIHLRNEAPIFRSKESTMMYPNFGNSVKTWDLSLNGEYAYVAMNTSSNTEERSFLMPKDTVYYDYWSGEELETIIVNGNPRLRVTMQPGTFKVYTTQQFERPDQDLLTNIIEDEVDMPTDTQLLPNYPNPFNPSTSIRFYLAQNGPANLQVFDLTGRLIQTLSQGVQTAGWHQYQWNAAALPSGVYLYRLQTESGVQTRKMTLIK